MRTCRAAPETGQLYRWTRARARQHGLPGVVGVRDSKDPPPALTFAPAAWHAFVAQLARRP
ncbi:DUF397 domain-containing protein [Micromonospora sp. NPDC049645]|uniref:DUF397 domain-containing protein n=1 Tax=Micromonospora sp. NPDC049645 TaxID=3155508 RepID=UPI00341E7628